MTSYALVSIDYDTKEIRRYARLPTRGFIQKSHEMSWNAQPPTDAQVAIMQEGFTAALLPFRLAYPGKILGRSRTAPIRGKSLLVEQEPEEKPD